MSLAYQIGFDLYDSASQHFLSNIVQALKAGTAPAMTSQAVDSEKEKKENIDQKEIPPVRNFFDI